MKKINPLYTFLVVTILGFAIRLILAWHTLSPLDVDSMYHIFQEIKNGNGIYSHNWYYFNNPPIWGWIVWLSGIISIKTGVWMSFWIKIPLMFSDFILSFLIFKYSQKTHAYKQSVFYYSLLFLNPFLIIVSSYHAQMESLFLLFLIASFLVLQSSKLNFKRVFLSSFLFGLSCLVKVIPLMVLPFFIIYLLRLKNINFKQRLIFALTFLLIPLAMFILIFLPYATDINYVLMRIIAYRAPFWGFWGVPALKTFIDFFYQSPTWLKSVMLTNQVVLLLFGLCVSTILIIKNKNNLLFSILITYFVIYLTSFYFSPHYLLWVIPFLLILLINKKLPLNMFIMYSLLSFILETVWLMALLGDFLNTYLRWEIIIRKTEVIIPNIIITLGNLINIPIYLLINFIVWLYCWFVVRKMYQNIDNKH